MTRWLIIILFSLVAFSAHAQQVIQSGKPKPGHASKWITNGVIGDAGPANGGPAGTGLTELNITGQGDRVCVNDAPTTGPYHQLCFSANNDSQGLISYNAFGGATPQPLDCLINGVATPCLGNTTQVSGIAFTSTNASLKAIAVPPQDPQVVRGGFYAIGDGGGAFYNYVTSACSISAGAGDDGSQVAPTSGSGCWIANLTGPALVQVWGAKCDGAANDGPALSRAAAVYSQLTLQPGKTCRVATTWMLTKFPIQIVGQEMWPFNAAGTPTTIKCDTGANDCVSTPLSTTQKPNVELRNIMFNGDLQNGGNILHLSNTIKSNFDKLTMNNVWNGIEIDGPNDNTNVFTNLSIQACRGEQGLLWVNGSMVNNSNVLTLSDGFITCGSATNGIVIDGNVQTIRIDKFAIIDSGIEFWMRNHVSSTACPGYVFFDDVEFNGGSHTANFIKADCGYSVQMVNGWSFGATTGDGFAFNLHTSPATVGSNILMINNSELLGNVVGGRCMFLNWNNSQISNTIFSGCQGDVFQVGPGAQRTIVNGGIITNDPNAANHCVSSTSDAALRSLFLNGTLVAGGCTAGLYNDPAEAIVLSGVIGGPPLLPMTGISGCGSGCTVAITNGNQAVGSILLNAGTAPAADGVFTMNFSVHLTPYPLCFVTPRRGGGGTWNNLATTSLLSGPSNGASIDVAWHNNGVPLSAGNGYFLDFRCSGLSD